MATIDVHAHFHPLSPGISESDVFGYAEQEAKSRIVEKMIIVSENHLDIPAILDLHRRYPKFYLACVGVHPVGSDGKSIKSLADVDRAKLENIIRDNIDDIIGVGECGLDFSPMVLDDAKSEADKDDLRNVQIAAFREQIRLASLFNLPLNVHSRNAGHHVLRILREQQSDKAILHAFDGRAQYVHESVHISGKKFMFSCPPSIVRSPGMQKWAASIPLDNLCLESDSPALAPTPGAVNHPENIRATLECLSRLRNLSSSDIARSTNKNAKSMFQIE